MKILDYRKEISDDLRTALQREASHISKKTPLGERCMEVHAHNQSILAEWYKGANGSPDFVFNHKLTMETAGKAVQA